jgi:hypothetical protein
MSDAALGPVMLAALASNRYQFWQNARFSAVAR